MDVAFSIFIIGGTKTYSEKSKISGCCKDERQSISQIDIELGHIKDRSIS